MDEMEAAAQTLARSRRGPSVSSQEGGGRGIQAAAQAGGQPGLASYAEWEGDSPALGGGHVDAQ